MNTILVIDDNHDYRADLMEILKFENFATLGAENGQIGLEMIRQHSPSLIICDVDMPVMNGMELLKTAKSDPNFAKIPFLIVSGGIDNLTSDNSHELVAEAYLAKPIDIPEFLSTIVGFLSAQDPA